MTKKDLENGMIVELRNSAKYLLLEGGMFDFEGYIGLVYYSDDLKHDYNKDYDIVKVYKETMAYSLTTMFNNGFLALIWERPEPPKLSEKEIEILKALDVLGFTHTARDRNGNIYAYYSEPKKLIEHNDYSWLNGSLYFEIKTDLFAFITWEDEKPTSIQELLSDFEKENKDFDR